MMQAFLQEFDEIDDPEGSENGCDNNYGHFNHVGLPPFQAISVDRRESLPQIVA